MGPDLNHLGFPREILLRLPSQGISAAAAILHQRAQQVDAASLDHRARLKSLFAGDWCFLDEPLDIRHVDNHVAITGKSPDGQPIKGDYKFTDEFPMADGFEENAEFFTLTYETPVAVNYQTAFIRIAPLLWLRAGSVGRRIDKLPAAGWAVADAYGLLVDLDKATDFLKAVRKSKGLRIAYIVTDDERRFQAIARQLPEGVEAIRLYESYLTNFAFANGDSA
jgi:hypothetical protein